MTPHADRDHTEPPVISDEPIGPAGGAPAGNPLHGIAHDRDADRTIPTSDEERLGRYAEAIYDGAEAVDPDERAVVTAAIMAVADAEQAELRAEVERQANLLRAINDCHRDPARAILQADRLAGAAIIRAHAAEAKVARVEALTPEVLTERVSASLQANQDQQVEAVVLDVIRAALAAPETTDATVYASMEHDREIHTPDTLEWPGKEDA